MNCFAAATLGAALCLPVAVTALAEPLHAYTVEVSDVSAKVGEHAVMRVTLRPHEGYRVLEHYTNRVSRFSSLDDGVAFDDKTVSGNVQNNTLVFVVGVTSTKPGKHPINGVFRVGYIENASSMWMISVPLIANVIGTQ
ncbi:MAG TPA: hypothetical protein VFW75_16600 [Acetobacteraceae bacterium]|nr:hypothetical protein [Acetobacteraceae bacterium]